MNTKPDAGAETCSVHELRAMLTESQKQVNTMPSRIEALESRMDRTDAFDLFSLILHGFVFVIVIVLTLIFATHVRGQTVASELTAARDDCKKLPSSVAGYTFYLSLYNIPPEDRVESIQSLSLVLNHISRSPVMVIPTRVNDSLVRFSILDLAPDAKDLKEWQTARERLADKEPYWHLQTEVAAEAVKSAVIPITAATVTTGAVSANTKDAAPVLGTGKPLTSGGNGRFSNNANAGSRQAVVAPALAIPAIPIPALSTTAADSSSSQPIKKTKIVTVDGGWIGLANAAELEKLTYSKIPIARLDQFIAQVTIPPFYYDFAGVPDDINDWLKKFGTTKAELFDSLKFNRFANLVRSGVTDKTRRAGSETTKLGRVWWTFDNRDIAAKKDVFRNPDQHVEIDASELIAIRPNGLHEFALANNKFKRQDAVPPDIAIDFSVNPPVQLQPMLSCIRCHSVSVAATGVGAKAVASYETNGLLSFVDQQSPLLSSKPDSRTKAAKGRLDFDNAKTAADIAAAYSDQEQLQLDLKRDREDYAKAVAKAAMGLTPTKAVAGVAKIVKDYQSLVTPMKACVELGIEPTEKTSAGAATALRVRFDGTHDPVLIMLAQEVGVQRPQWEASFQEASLLSEANKPVAVSVKAEEAKVAKGAKAEKQDDER